MSVLVIRNLCAYLISGGHKSFMKSFMNCGLLSECQINVARNGQSPSYLDMKAGRCDKPYTGQISPIWPVTGVDGPSPR